MQAVIRKGGGQTYRRISHLLLSRALSPTVTRGKMRNGPSAKSLLRLRAGSAHHGPRCDHPPLGRKGSANRPGICASRGARRTEGARPPVASRFPLGHQPAHYLPETGTQGANLRGSRLGGGHRWVAADQGVSLIYVGVPHRLFEAGAQVRVLSGAPTTTETALTSGYLLVETRSPLPEPARRRPECQ
jgi:hypothetical protein